MRILEDHQHRTFGAPAPRSARSALPAFFAGAAAGRGRARDSGRRSAATASRRRARRPRSRSRICASSASSLSSFVLASSSRAKSGGALHLADDRIERAVGVLRRAEIAQARMRLAGEALQQRGRQPRFADARLAGEQHDLALARLRLGPAPQQAVRILLPARRARSGRSRAAPRSGSPANSPAAPPRRASARRCP